MDKRAVIACFIVFLLIISVGCTQLGLGTKVSQKESETMGESVYKGLRGLTMNFIKNNPPRILYTTSPLSMIIELKNEGASNIAGGKLVIGGLDPAIIKLDKTLQTFNVEGRSKFNTVGGYQTVDFNSQAISLPGRTDVYRPTIMVSACYEYQTKAAPLVCIDPDPYSILEKEACEVRNVALGGGQGAPVYVSKVEEEAIPNNVNFKIYVANQPGVGVVIDKSGYSMNNCPNSLQPSDLDTVEYAVSMPGVTGGTCQPKMSGQSKIKLANNQGVIFCTFPVSSTGKAAYQTVLNIDLSYGYLSQISQQIEIRSIS